MKNSGVSQRKKLEEQNAQAIRKLLTEDANKYCFDCGQRGPTYVNMTIGAYICMHCSGLIRGLHPPHRVKSISMSSFTNDEVERLKTLGNSVNSAIYLGLYDGKKKFEPRIEEEVKSHLIEKYENRRWYVSPTDVEIQKQLLEEHARRNSLSAVSMNSHKSNQSAPPNLQTSARSGPIDLLTGDLFDLSLSSTPVQQVANQTTKSIDIKTTQDDWADLFSTPIAPTEPSTFPLNTASSVPAPLQFPMTHIPPPKPKEHVTATNLFENQPHQGWESFVSMPKSATVGPTSNSSTLDELFSKSSNGQRTTVVDSRSQNEFATNFDSFASPSTTSQNNGSMKYPDSWNPFLS